MATQRITERFAFSGGKADRDAGTIADCVICGDTSANGNDYDWRKKLRGEHVKYEGAPSNCDHGKEDTIDRRLGWFTNVEPGPDGKPRGTFHLLRSHPMYERVMEAAERNPKLFGFSHVIEAETTRGKNGRYVVESIKKVISIDLVATPATTTSLFESTGSQPVTTLRKVIESLRDKLPAERQPPARRLLLVAEDDAGMGAVLDAPVEEPAAETDPDQAISDAFKQAMHAQIDALLAGSHTLAELISKIRELGKAHGKLTGAKTGGGEEEETAEESKRLDKDAMLAECRERKFSPSYEQGETLRDIPSKQARELVIESMKAAAKVSEAESPRSQPRPAVKPPLKESRQPELSLVDGPLGWKVN